MRQFNSLGNRLVALVLSIVMVLGMVPSSVIAVENTPAYGTVESLTDGVTIGQTGAEVKATYGGTLNWTAKDESIGRMNDGWWVGLKITAPAGMTKEEQFTNVKYRRLDNEVWSEPKPFWDAQDSDKNAEDTARFLTLWGLASEETLRNANQTDGLSTYTWAFDWDGNGEFEQTVVLDIDAARTILLNNANERVYPVASIRNGEVAGITEGSSIATNGNTTTVTYADVTLDWDAADPAAGRGQDGWWVGMKITAPAELTKEANFANVTYQSYGTDGWSAAKSFWNAQDSDKTVEDTARYLTMWGMVSPELIANDDDKVLTYQYRFDWNGDGIYEQNLVLKIDATTVKLMKNGIQQLPLQYGTVESITEGNVTGSGTAESVISFEDITLTWDKADPVAGRGQDGWWVGAKITAPATMTTEAVCGNIKYQRYESGAWSEAKSFWSAQDSDKNAADTARYLTMWCLVTPELIAKDNDGILTLQYRFDWNQDDEYEQQLTMKVNASKVTLLNENNVQVYPTLGVVTPLTNGTVTGSGTGETSVLIKDVTIAWSEKDEALGRGQDGWWTGIKVTAPSSVDLENIKYRRKTADGWTEAMAYAPDDGTADTMQLWGLVTAEYLDQFIGYGRNMNYTWQFDWNNDGIFEQTVTMSVDPSNITLKQVGFDFSVDADTITYGDNNNIYTILAPTGGQAGHLEYSISDPTVAKLNDDGTLTILKADTVVITATLSGEHYENITASYTLNIEKADQSINFETVTEEDQLVWQAASIELPTITGKLSGGHAPVSYTITKGDNEVAKIENGQLYLLKSGYFEMTIVAGGDDCYNESNTLTWKVTVEKANQTGFGFSANTDTVTYNAVDKNAATGSDAVNKYTLITNGGQTSGQVTYVVVLEDGKTAEDYPVDLEIHDGVLDILRSGKVTIKATKAGDDCYKDTTAELVLTVKKAEQSFTFVHDKAIEEKYGLTSFETKITPSALNSGKITYAVSGDAIGAEVNNSGLVTFANSTAKVGKITVTVTMVEDDCYKPCTDTYTITLGYEATPDNPYALDGDKIVDDSDWFTGDVKIYAPNDYQISYSNDLTDNEWEEEYVEWKVDGEAGTWAAGSEPVVYLKNSKTGAITDAIPVSDLKRDTVRPNGLAISYDVSVWATIGEKLFGFNASTVKVTVTAADSLSGIGKMEYSLDGGNTYTEITASNGAYEFSVPSQDRVQYRGQLWMRATDVAGNPEVYKHLDNNTDKILVVDHTEPGLTVGYTGSMNDADTSGIRYVNSDKVTVVFEITDENFDLRAADPIVTVNGVAETGWVYDATSGTLTFDLTDEGDYKIEASFSDRLNREVTYEAEVRVDRTKPVIESTIVNGRYYTENQAFVLTITEHNFDASKVNLDINAVDSKNNPVLTADEVEKFADDAKVLVNWDHTEGTDIYTLKLPVTKDGNYTVTIDCTDVLGWNEEYEVAFTLDKVVPTASVITYETVQEETIMSKLFGFSKETVRVSIQTSDLTSGVDYIQLNIIPEGPAEATDLTMPLNLEINADGTVRSGDKGFIDEISVVGTADDLTFSFNLPAQFRGFIEANAYDKAAWNTESVDGIEIVVDSIAPGLFAKYTGGMDDSAEEGIRYVNGEKVSVAFEITDENFDLRAADPVVTVNGVAKTGWVYDATSGTLTFDLADEGDYVIKAEFTDRLDRKVSYESEVRVDRTKPVIESDIVNKKYYTENQTFVLTITEHNFDAAKVNLVVNAVDSKGAAVLHADEIKKFADDAKVLGNWNHTEGTDVYTLKLPITKDGNYAVTIECTDVLGWNEEYEVAFTLDKKAPVDLKIEYSEPANTLWQDILRVITFGAYNAEKPLIVTLSATDEIAGVDYFEWFYTRETGASESNKPSGSAETSNILYVTQLLGDADASVSSVSFEIDPQARGYITFRATDYAGNTYGVDADPETEDEWVEDYERINIVDTIAPNRTITLAPEVIYDAQSKTAVDSFVEGDYVILYYEKEALVTIDIVEANFYADDVQIAVTKNGEDHPVDVEWEHKQADHYQGTFTLAGDGDYAVEVSYMDRSQNEMVDLTGAYTTYTSPQIHIDDTIPVISVSYEPEEGNTNGLYFKEDRVATVKITEHNFDATKVKAVVTAKNILGKDVTAAETTEIATYLSDPANWTEVAADVYEAQVTFATDAHYTFTLDCMDIVGNTADTYVEEAFVVDHKAPVDLKIEYSEPANTLWQDILKVITFGAYNAEKPLIVTLTATDEIAGVDYFEWFYTREVGASEINTASGTAETSNILYVSQLLEGEDASVSSVSFEIEPEARGYITFRATDYAGNTYGVVEGNDDQWVADTDRINIVDTIAPGRTVTLKPNAAYNAETLERVETFVEEENVILYYKERPVITIDIVEANFYGEDVQVFVTTDPEDLSGAINYSNEVSWNSANADEHQGVVTLKETDGDYYVVIMYTDRSLNEMVTYTSQRIVVDETLPEITVEYANKPENALNTLKDKDGNDRQYFFEDQTAVISIKEKNFRADDVKIYVKAQDLLGKNVNAATLTFDADGNVVQYFAQGANRGEWEKLTPYEAEWRREDNTYKLELHYSADANYTFDIVYADMATNEAKDYEPNYFTVDKVAPTPLAAEYSTEGVNVFDNILAGITFGFYDAKMTVTISASDEISGVHRFAYSYLKSEGVSPVNAELLNEAIESAKITQVDGTYTYTASFEIPKEVLTRDNQFNGTVEFSSFDRSENKSEAKSNTNRIIVDNIAPTATISYNAPVKQLGNVSYYAGNINASIVINEANFYSEDVVVTVNDKPVAVSWSDNSVDVHTGTFTLSSDGDYVVKVTYTDRSTNKMEDYTSNQLTIDTKAPVIQVSDVKHESANNGETISFTVQVTDRNIALENFKPSLSVLVKKDNGNNQYSFETVAIDLGQAKTSVNGNGDTVYTYTVENLEVDGFYSLVCEAVDHANHTVSAINSANNADQNTTVETVNFSVNREGSVFWITTEHTEGGETITDQLHGKYVNGEVIVRIHEINVDKVDDGKATIFTLNDGSSAEDIVLDETNYKKNVSIGAGGWYQTDYILDNEYFLDDGVYSINIITYDKATNSNVNTKSEEGTITFTVDRTKPVISANLTSRQIINDTQYKVYFQITELNLNAETIVVKYNGETVALENLGNNEYGFTVREGLNQSVQITAVDLAGNESELFEAAPFTVSTNIFVRWYATGFWFWFPIIAVPLLIGLIILLIVLKKKKKER